MDWNRVEGNWKQMKGKIKEKWGNLTDDDLPPSTASGISLRARFKSATASPRIRSKKTWTTGTTRRRGNAHELCSGPNSHFVSSVGAGNGEPFPH
jgi:hypothetical protein